MKATASAAACWIIVSRTRTRRLALLISSCPGVTPAESRPRIPAEAAMIGQRIRHSWIRGGASKPIFIR
jgi:hypothetical protein